MWRAPSIELRAARINNFGWAKVELRDYSLYSSEICETRTTVTTVKSPYLGRALVTLSRARNGHLKNL